MEGMWRWMKLHAKKRWGRIASEDLDTCNLKVQCGIFFANRSLEGANALVHLFELCKRWVWLDEINVGLAVVAAKGHVPAVHAAAGAGGKTHDPVLEVLKRLADMDAQEQEEKAKAFVGTGEAKPQGQAGRTKAKKAVPQLVAGKKTWTGMMLKDTTPSSGW
jgi:hypothetical protein